MEDNYLKLTEKEKFEILKKEMKERENFYKNTKGNIIFSDGDLPEEWEKALDIASDIMWELVSVDGQDACIYSETIIYHFLQITRFRLQCL